MTCVVSEFFHNQSLQNGNKHFHMCLYEHVKKLHNFTSDDEKKI